MPRKFNEIAAEIEASPERRARVDAYDREMREQILVLQRRPYSTGEDW